MVDLDVYMQAKQKPDGGNWFPGKTCRDLQLCDKNIKSGEYYVDPNLGCPSDKFLVDCNFDNGRAETCVRPKKTIYDDDSSVGKYLATMDVADKWRYLVNDLKSVSDEIKYDADEVALRFLRLNSMNVRQNFTYRCKNQHAYKDNKGIIDRHVMIRTADGAEIDTDKARNKMFLDVLRDECNKRDGKWHSAVFELSTKKTSALPITDIKIKHTTPTGSTYESTKFEIELGSICFS